ncbi:STE20-related kinase adapter protein alpha [Neodiprion fabricii]|uniref:STE20-related kinase adapter protein alpha n=1 Tax=Neodiprion fabricii TaxID=2872261 RepID=UPI001ED93698|nr:STE20-related kinase adapter protein alpha [Neodiprion fabricii]
MHDSDSDNYEGSAVLGMCCNGAGSVHLARYKPKNTHVVIKKFNMDNRSHEEYDLVEQEIIMTRQLQHPNILPYLATFVSGHNICVVSPLMGYGSCHDLIEEYFNEGLPELAIAYILRDILHGLEYIHKRGFIHRAIKASHILISTSGQACLSGMRYACEIVRHGKWQRTIHSFPKSTTNNLKWLSPELLQQDLHGYNEKSDTYSLGMTICELANGVVPFCDTPATLMLTEKVRGSAPHILDRSTIPPNTMDTEDDENGEKKLVCDNIVGDGNASTSSLESVRTRLHNMSSRKFSEPFHALTELCLLRNPSDRPTMSQLAVHPFFKQCRRNDESLIEILRCVTSISEKHAHSAGDYLVALSTEQLVDLDLETCQWDF